MFFYRARFWSLVVAGKRLSQMGVATKEKDLRLRFSVLGFPTYSLADSNCVFKLSLCLCLTPFFFFFFFFFLFFKISIWSDGSGDKEEGFGSRVFSFGVSTYSLANSNRVSKAEFVFMSNAFFFLFFFFFLF